jgi:hypothetical protein
MREIIEPHDCHDGSARPSREGDPETATRPAGRVDEDRSAR